MPTVPYFYLRLLELEGRHPHDAGAWSPTFHRLSAGEGQMPDDRPEASVPYTGGEAYPPAPKVAPYVTRPYRWFFYRRLRSSAECERYLLARPGESRPSINIPLTTAWADPPDGHIPMPDVRTLLPNTHNVFTWGCVPQERLFLFNNSWGEGWGHEGRAALPYDYFDNYCFDSWVNYLTSKDVRRYREWKLSPKGSFRWSGRDEDDRTRYGYEVRNPADDDRLGWAFAVERDEGIEVEELYVRPAFRGRGHGRWLGNQLLDLARAKSLPIRVWVPFADTRRESPSTYPVMVATLRRMGLQFGPSRVRWAAYLATNEGPGSNEPVEPEVFPERPRSPREVVVAAALALGVGTPPAAVGPPSAQVESVAADFPSIGTPEWGKMNQERAALIRKKVRGELTPPERERYEFLQSRSLAALERAFPLGAVDGR